MEINELKCRDPFVTSESDVCRVLAGWQNKYGNNHNRFLESNN